MDGLPNNQVTLHNLFIAEVRIGFLDTEYSVSESEGQVPIRFGVLEGMLGFDVDLQFNTGDGSAISEFQKACPVCPHLFVSV